MLIAILSLAPAAFCQNARYDNVVIGPRGPIANATIAVCTQPATISTTPCSPLASLFNTAAGGGAAPNPLLSDSSGNYHFYVAPGIYTIQIYGAQLQTPFVMTDIGVGAVLGGATLGGNNAFTGNNTEGFWNSVRIVDGVKFTTCNAAVADLGANPGIVIIPSIYVGAECSVTPDNITLWDFRAGSSRVAQGVHYRVNDSSTHIRMFVGDVLNASNLTNNQNHAELYGKVNYNGNPTGGNQVVEGIAGLAGTDTTISGSFPGQIIGVEGTCDVAATGGFTVGTCKGGTFNTTLSAGNTNVSQMFSLYAQAPSKVGTGVITQAASFVAEDPCVGACPASSVNLSGWFLGDTRIDKHISQAVAPSASIGHFSRVSNFTGVGQQGMFIAPTFSSGATTEGEAIMARADLVAAAFTQALNANFYSANPVFGGGSSATNHYGYYAEPQTAGVTNYAYYAAGTEASFFGGPVQHGEIAAPSAVAGKDICYGDSTAHALKCSYNNGSYFNMPQVIISGTTTLTANAALAAVTSQAANTTAATGVLTTDAIEWSFATAPTAGDNLCHVLTYVTAGNVNFVRTNPTAAAQNVSALVINWRVIR